MVSIDISKINPDKPVENEIVSMDLDETDSDKRVERRRPDRIIGFQETHSFSRRLEKYDPMAGQSENEAGKVTLWETVESTVLNHKGNSLLFPFLIIEAKSRHGAPFDYCNSADCRTNLENVENAGRLAKEVKYDPGVWGSFGLVHCV